MAEATSAPKYYTTLHPTAYQSANGTPSYSRNSSWLKPEGPLPLAKTI